ncbi:hypothetical protein [Nitrobacter sp.]|uniref:hypothetical protein n=1 Tax=Nitrobacter sp. TaxID=29420 RepID=UPI001D1D89D1|nr:hypothetical protein [Nitrobacter sp.]MCB1394300.1 hypothetical protein [Nitrobacter sp.]
MLEDVLLAIALIGAALALWAYVLGLRMLADAIEQLNHRLYEVSDLRSMLDVRSIKVMFDPENQTFVEIWPRNSGPRAFTQKNSDQDGNSAAPGA